MVKLDTHYDKAVLPLGIYPREMLESVYKRTCTNNVPEVL